MSLHTLTHSDPVLSRYGTATLPTALKWKTCVYFQTGSRVSVRPCPPSAGRAVERLGDSRTGPRKASPTTARQRWWPPKAWVNSIYREKCDSRQNGRLITQITEDRTGLAASQCWLRTCLSPRVFVSHICFMFQKKGCSHFWQESLSNHCGAWGGERQSRRQGASAMAFQKPTQQCWQCGGWCLKPPQYVMALAIFSIRFVFYVIFIILVTFEGLVNFQSIRKRK